MPYIREWETLGEALQRVQASGQSEGEAERDLCNAIADRAIEVRAHCVDGDVLPGHKMAIPARLDPAALSCSASCPLVPWQRQPSPADGYFDRDLQIQVHLLELRRDDVTRVVLHGSAAPAAPGSTEAPSSEPVMAQTQAAKTMAAETRLTQWLQTQMKAAPNEPRAKSQIKTDAKAAGLSFSGHAFVRAWRSAVISTDAVAWSKPGRKSKRRIDTAV